MTKTCLGSDPESEVCLRKAGSYPKLKPRAPGCSFPFFSAAKTAVTLSYSFHPLRAKTIYTIPAAKGREVCDVLHLRPGLYSWWGPLSYKLGGLLLWAVRLRKTNGKNFTWPMLDFCSALPHGIMTRLGKIYPGQPLEIKTRAELLASIKPVYWQHLRSDCGDLPMAIEPGLLAEPPKARVEQPVAG